MSEVLLIGGPLHGQRRNIVNVHLASRHYVDELGDTKFVQPTKADEGTYVIQCHQRHQYTTQGGKFLGVLKYTLTRITYYVGGDEVGNRVVILPDKELP